MQIAVRTALAGLAIMGAAGLAACTTDGGGMAPQASSPAIDPTLATACANAASAKYFVAPERARAISAEKKGGVYEVTMKVDTRDALCTVTSAGSVSSLVDTTPMSADQLAAEKKAQEPKKKSSAD